MLTFKQFNETIEHDYMYHGTNHYNLHDIIDSGKIKVFKPWHGTDQDTFPDGSTKSRSYWTSNINSTQYFFPEEGNPEILRVKTSRHPFKKEKGTGDFYLEKSIPLDGVEVLRDGEWESLLKN